MRAFFLYFLLLVSAVASRVTADNIDWNAPLPVDSNLRYGVLANGLTYYVFPQPGFGTVNMKLVTRIGSVVENENERGLAHFLEHMTFEGTESYPDDMAVKLLQNYGLHMGADVNASTGFDDTQFDIKNIPSNDTTLFLHSLSILSDWACNLTLTDSAIAKQKGIVLEEWRTGHDYNERMLDAMCKALLAGSRYADRTPIGSMDVITNLDSKTLTEFYHRWYRPDLQAIMVVGDCDPDITVDAIKYLFGPIKRPDNPETRQAYELPFHKGLNYCKFVDPEAASTPVGIFFQHAKPSRERLNTRAYYRDYAIQRLAVTMLNLRLGEACLKQGAPMSSAQCDYEDFLVAATADAFGLSADAKQGQSLETYTELLTEARRAQVHGFSESELERAKSFLLGRIDNTLEENENQHRNDYIESYIENFEQGTDLYDMKQSALLLRDIVINHCPLSDIDNYIHDIITPDNVSVMIAGPQTDEATYPDKATLDKVFKEVFESTPDKYDDSMSAAPILSTPPTPGIISNCTTSDSIVYTVTLGNGATVVLLPTTVKNDEILFNAYSNGGWMAYDNKHSEALRAMNDVIEYSALGGIPYNELKKRLINTNLSLVFELTPYQDTFTGNSGKRDLETLFQVLYLYFTDIQKDNQSFDAYKSAMISDYRQSRSNPKVIFTDSILSTVYPDIAYAKTLNEEDVNRLDYDELLSLYRERVANPGDYVFTFVGNFTVDSIMPLISTYIASIPDNGMREEPVMKSLVRRGNYSNSFKLPMLTPKTSVEMEIYAPCTFSIKNKVLTDMLTNAFDILINNEIREKMNSSYGASVVCDLEEYSNQFEFKCLFDTNNADADEVYKICRQVIDSTLRNGISAETFNDIYNQQVNSFYFAINANSFWAYHLYLYAKGYDYVNELQTTLMDLTVEKFNHFIASLMPISDLTTIMKGE